MSEYQYFEFRAVDRRLTDDDMLALRGMSSRAKITPTSFVNVYHYGDFKGEPSELMERFFDVHVYVANWGSHELMVRVPSSLLELDAARQYAPDTPVLARSHGGHTILDVLSYDEDYATFTEDGERWMERLIPVRDEIMNGDLRALYIGWLLLTMYDEPGSEEIEPPVPPGIGQLSPALEALVEFLRIDRDLIAVAAERSAPLQESAPREDDLRGWIERLPAREKDDLLLRAMTDDDAHLGARLLKEFRQSKGAGVPGVDSPPARRRTAGEMIALWERKTAERKQAEAQREERKHAARMDDVAARAEELWLGVDQLVESRDQKSYNLAITHPRDLHAAATHYGAIADFDRRLSEVRARHARKTSFVRMVDDIGKPKRSSDMLVWNRDRS